MDLTKIAISIVGDANHYLRSVNMVIRETQRMARVITYSLTGSVGAGLLAGLTLTPLLISANLASTAIERTLQTTVRLTSEAIKLGTEFERVQINFGTMVGDAEKGRRLFAELNQLALRNPFTTRQMIHGGEMLLGMGANPDHIVRQMDRLSNIAGGDPDKLRRLTYDFGEVLAYNRVDSRILRQFSTMGVGVKDFAKTAGMSMSEFKAALHNGEIGVNVMIDTINRLTSEGGRFANNNERQMKSVQGAWSNLVDSLEVKTGTIMADIFQRTHLADGLNDLADSIQKFDGSKIVKFFEDFARAAAPARDVLKAAKEMFVGDMNISGERVGKGFVDFLTQSLILITKMERQWKIFELTVSSYRISNLPEDHALVRFDKWMTKQFGTPFEAANKTANAVDSMMLSIDKAMGRELPNTSKANELMGGATSMNKSLMDQRASEMYNEAMTRLGYLGMTMQFGDNNAPLQAKADAAFKALNEELKKRGQGTFSGENYQRFMKEGVQSLEQSKQAMKPADKYARELAEARDSLRNAESDVLAQIGKASRQREPSGGLVGLMVAGAESYRYKTGGLIPRENAIDPRAQEYAIRMIQELRQGTTPFEKFQQSMKFANQAYYGVGPGWNPFGPGLGSELNQEQYRYAIAKNYMELANSVRGIVDASLPKAELRGSSEAQDTINRSNEQQLTVQEEIARAVAISAQLDALNGERLQAIADVLTKWPGVTGRRP